MSKVKDFISKYTIQELFVMVLGAIGLIVQSLWYFMRTLEGNTLDGIVFSIAILFLFKPKFVVSLISKKASSK